ncbi:L-type lectin-domain containing receptor kinase IX.1-like [Phragmites australis]|uniref:L-type lectin-domain containing receptor kinase IX.1-like n=1 Tax=Phragmites australis TaxID=29695 RepID=UPI002D77DE64|nr:L-type lectin-domain containing receptor kinase IX.1-like [Phragmites australis]
MAAARSAPFPLALICLHCLFALCIHVPSASSLEFSFNFSKTGDPCGGELVCTGEAYFASSMIELTRNDKNNNDGEGRVWHTTPVPLWNSVTGEVASFTTAFSFMVTADPGCKIWGDGIAFFLAHYSSDSILEKNTSGGLLGLFNDSNNFNVTGDNQVVSIEFDTFHNEEWDTSSQHVGIHVNSVKSTALASMDTSLPGIKSLTSDSAMTAVVHYDNGAKSLTVDLQANGDTNWYHINATVDLRTSLPEEVAVGFSAATGMAGELHRILSWSFNSTLEKTAASIAALPAPAFQPPPAVAPSDLIPPVKSEPSTNILFEVLVPILAVSVAAIPGLLLWLRHKRRRNVQPNQATNNGIEPNEEHDEADFERGVARPRRYHYRELATATGDFADKNMLGRGGFGSVYQGRLQSDVNYGQQVAIKKFSAESSQGRREFEAEVRIISRLRHRNLVQLLGWCDSPKGLLLVYELVPEGSLDKHIHDNKRLLTWSERYKIILGLGSALRYLHQEWEQCVVHGDIKPSNIMLDSSYNAKLGDFGLARLVDHGTGLRTTMHVLGTAGYIDPEFVNTRRPSTESDVYSFGIVLLEIVSGRPPVFLPEGEAPFLLLKWVRSLYSQGATLDAVDPRLRGDEDDERQMERALVVGLWCARHDPAERPSIAQAMLVLQSEDTRLPAISPQMSKLAAMPSVLSVPERRVSGSSFSSGVRSSTTTSTTTRSSESFATDRTYPRPVPW